MAFVEFQCSIIWFMIVSMSNTHVKTTVTLEVAGADGLCQTKQIRVSQQWCGMSNEKRDPGCLGPVYGDIGYII